MPPWIRELIWDRWNVDHIARHGVEPDEVYEVCFGDPLVGRAMRNGKRPVLGQTHAGRYLWIILGDRGEGDFYPISARDMTLTERRRYQRQRGM